jgi:hypothetical protein
VRSERDSPSLYIPSAYLVQGRAYTFRVSYESAQTCGGFSKTLSFTVNQSPFGGSCSRDLASGRTLSTLFTLATQNWTDSDNNTPLTFSFEFKRASETAASSLTGFRPVAELTT